jgi:hypothetical protein
VVNKFLEVRLTLCYTKLGVKCAKTFSVRRVIPVVVSVN